LHDFTTLKSGFYSFTSVKATKCSFTTINLPILPVKLVKIHEIVTSKNSYYSWGQIGLDAYPQWLENGCPLGIEPKFKTHGMDQVNEN
jgi:hypothetical protein